ncbi:histidine kinase [Sphingomonas sp. HMP9]|uniref:sensor histidine kinase n=1 Tax=Sphingomonas sp. HMP9 TaxID=1517554 RepID=UPI00159666EE|nr:HAMP domain-containing sensor histidine kinase [Sphingomonas sp. HMP9]BCA61007.1 histidine kinase [Sphingomonas sp. HMP9]
MASDRTRAAVRALVIAAAGAGGAVAATRGLYATALLAAMIAIWIAALNLVDTGQRAPTPAPPLPAASAGDEERRRLNAYLDLSPAPLVAFDDGRLRAVNRAARRLLGAGDLVADPPEGLVTALADTRPGRTTTIDIGHDVDMRSFALATSDLVLAGRMTRIGALIDIDAELKAAEAAALRELVQVLSHEIVNALTPIASLAETAVAMLDDPDPMLPKVRDAVETVARRAASLHRFGESYRALAKLPAPSAVRVPVAGFVSDLAALFTTRWPTIAFTTDMLEAPAYLLVDPDQLTAALWAVLQNAAEALHAWPDTRVTLSISARVGQTQFTITDTGPGIPAGNQADIFRPFFTTKSEGTGVGLALARQIFRGHNGDLGLAQSSPGRTRFEGTLPSVPIS